MMKNNTLVKLLLLNTFFMVILFSQEKDFPQLSQENVNNGKITRTEFYLREELWGLINGGADLYLEYGLDRTLLQEVDYEEKSFRVEVYGMTSVEAAFGIYSINKFNCALTDSLVKYICVTPNHLQAAVGRYYISISNQSGDIAAQKYSFRLFESLVAKIKAKDFNIPKYFQQPQFEKYLNKTKLIKGNLGFQNGLPRWDKFFTEFSNYEIVLLPIKTEEGFVNIASVVFNSENDAERFLSTNKNFSRIETLSQKEFILLESNLDQVNLDKILN